MQMTFFNDNLPLEFALTASFSPIAGIQTWSIPIPSHPLTNMISLTYSFSLVRHETNDSLSLCFLWSQVQPHSSNLVYNTLLELYLNDAARQKNVEVPLLSRNNIMSRNHEMSCHITTESKDGL